MARQYEDGSVFFDKAAAFLDYAGPHLEADEDRNTVVLGVAMAMQRTGWVPPLAAAVASGGQAEIVAIMTPPHSLVLSQGSASAAASLARRLAGDSWDIPGVVGQTTRAEAFAKTWQGETGQSYRNSMETILHRLSEVADLPAVPGHLGPARATDETLLAGWYQAAAEEMGLDEHEVSGAADLVARRLGSGMLCCWYDAGQPVAMAGFMTTSLRHRCGRINLVFTPPALRGKGYATACVGGLCRQRLASGWRHCLIFTDRDSPVTNHIYPKLGFRAIEQFCNLRFSAE